MESWKQKVTQKANWLLQFIQEKRLALLLGTILHISKGLLMCEVHFVSKSRVHCIAFCFRKAVYIMQAFEIVLPSLKKTKSSVNSTGGEAFPNICVCISTHHIAHFKYPTILLINYNSGKNDILKNS